MKYKRFLQHLCAIVFAAFVALSGIAISSAQESSDIESGLTEQPQIFESEIQTEEPVYTDPVPQTEYVEPETEYVEPETEYVEPETEYVEPETEYVEPQTIAPIGDIDYADPTEFIPPTMPKTVSKKTYSTNYTAGVVSWVCVGVGVMVVIVVLVSTKLSGRRNYGRV